MELRNPEPPLPGHVTRRWPVVDRPDSRLAVVSQWVAGGPDRQRAAADHILAAWDVVPWPRDLLALSLFLSTDGEAVLSYAQWKNAESVPELMKAQGEKLGEGLDAAVPGLEGTGPVPYRLYRSGSREGAPVPGVVVIVSVTFEGPDESRQRRWVDTVFQAMAAEKDPHPGGISGHFHLGTDGERVLNYAEWTTEGAHRDALERSAQGTVGSGPLWQRVKTFPGVVSGGFRRYHIYRSLEGE